MTVLWREQFCNNLIISNLHHFLFDKKTITNYGIQKVEKTFLSVLYRWSDRNVWPSKYVNWLCCISVKMWHYVLLRTYKYEPNYFSNITSTVTLSGMNDCILFFLFQSLWIFTILHLLKELWKKTSYQLSAISYRITIRDLLRIRNYNKYRFYR